MTRFDPERILTALREHSVEYVAVGAVALAAYGVVRATEDIDIIPAPDAENLEALATAIRSLEGLPHGEPDTQVSADLLARDANMRFDTAAGRLDVLCGEQYRGRFAELRGRAKEIGLDGTLVVVVSRDDLILLKAGSGRDRDLLDIGDLLAADD